MGQANYSAFNKWKKVWVAGFLEKKHRSIISGQNRLKKGWEGPLHWETVAADFLKTFGNWPPLFNFDNAESNRRQWMEMFLKKCSSDIREERKKVRRGSKSPGIDLGMRASKQATSTLPELPNSAFMDAFGSVSNRKDMVLTPKWLQASYTDLRHWEELIDFIDENRGPKEPYIMTSMLKCTSEQAEWYKEFMESYTNGQMRMDPICGQISYNCGLSNAFKLKPGHNPKIFLVESKRATKKEIAKHFIGPAKVIPASVSNRSG